MATLSVPSPNRHRASSTNVRPPLTLCSLGSRRRSNSLLDLPTPVGSPCQSPALESEFTISPLPPIPPPRSQAPPESKLASMVSRCLQLLHVVPRHAFPSSPSSPRISRASTDDTILPMSASPTHLSFVDVFPEKFGQHPASSREWPWGAMPSIHAPVLFVLMLFPLSTALVVASMYTLPITMSWPRTLADLAELGRDLHGYSQSGAGSMAHVLGVISITAVWKHAWSIPGSVIWNVLAGALLSPFYATVLCTFLTTMGSISATLLSAPLAPFLARMFPRALELTRTAIEGDTSVDDGKDKSSAWVRLSILRLVGVVPWSGINVACGVCGVAIRDCIFGSFIGSLPWTAVTCQLGDILQTVASNPSPTSQTVQSLLTSPEILMKLAFLSILSLAPVLGRNQLRMWVSSASAIPLLDRGQPNTSEKRVSRWVWITDWQKRIRAPSRSRTREAFQKELEALTQEKNASLPL
ncbi:hypothetical protein B0H21DRAFT_183979 [Amylocystis lapponica]|nr:hypothetical protein B0H21DRAFT_183979 [Amylocystis lapponica]